MPRPKLHNSVLKCTRCQGKGLEADMADPSLKLDKNMFEKGQFNKRNAIR